MQEKCIEHNMSLYIVFYDFSKAFDNVSRADLWQVFEMFWQNKEIFPHY